MSEVHAKFNDPVPGPNKDDGYYVTAAAAAKRPRKRWTTEKRGLMAEVALTVRNRNLPHIPERAKDIFLAAAGDLLQGGYDLALVRKVAIDAALDYDDVRGYSKLTQLRLRVRAEQNRLNLEEHHAHRRAEETPFPASVAAVRLMRDSFRGVPIADWNHRCLTDGCERTALYRQPHCADHV